MLWQEERVDHCNEGIDEIVDLAFGISCHCLPVDHAYALSCAVQKELPWFDDEQHAGIHTINVAASGNGWVRPTAAGDLLYPSRRTKFLLRIPKYRVEDARRLVGAILDVAGYGIEVIGVNVRPLSIIKIIFARYVVSAEGVDEQEFTTRTVRQLQDMGVQPKKLLCGMERSISTPAREIKTRSLMIADLAIGEAMILQQRGLGPHRNLGCGLFLPHKDIARVG